MSPEMKALAARLGFQATDHRWKDNLRLLRRHYGSTPVLAAAVGASNSAVKSWLSGSSKPHPRSRSLINEVAAGYKSRVKRPSIFDQQQRLLKNIDDSLDGERREILSRIEAKLTTLLGILEAV